MIRARSKALARLYQLYSTEIRPPAAKNSLSRNNNTLSTSSSISLSKHPHAEAEAYAEEQTKQRQNGLTTLLPSPSSTHPKPISVCVSMHPPFHTHNFVTTLEYCLPTPIARTLMLATRAMLIQKIGHCRREGLDKKDMDNQAYLFNAALTELRNDTAMRIRNETASFNTSTAACRKELDNLSAQMKEQLDILRHENQMEVDNRKNEARTDLKKQTLLLENVTSKAMIQLGDLRTEMERTRWMNMYRSILSLATVGAMIILFMEITKSREPAKKSATATVPTSPLPLPGHYEELKRLENETAEASNYVT